ncbi:HAD family hydrolase [Nocardioides massiliensis]|uniref:Cof subfamily protein (Haloacid dehalogenase superfamily) n=1 Tax=Nocardioides massiliensis TaxID=1325935 RepID=A0ABT9NLB8_9ACTN|nr:HAD family hydrolase [Nocardioides massiliensis]MDP9821213.1 Cof subfamily protein (haloacid dehalogenase superfamily) [Nocardioides massiliensis]
MYKLVATDLDGTLLDSRGEVSPRTREVISALEERGIVVVFVTGRPLRWMETLWEHVGDHGLAVCSNGGIVYDVRTHRVVRSRTIPRTTGLEVADRLRSELPGTAYALERLDGIAVEEQFGLRFPRPSDLRIGPLEDYFEDDAVVKLLAKHDAHDPEPYWHRVEELVGDLVTTTWSSVGTLVEMSAEQVTKATTLAQVCLDRGIAPEEVVAFGDMPNDLAMLSWAGRSYAMANAHAQVRAAADHVAPPHDQDGVAQALEELFAL